MIDREVGITLRRAIRSVGFFERMGLMAGLGIQLWPILQDMSQLRALYGQRAATFVANAGVRIRFGG